MKVIIGGETIGLGRTEDQPTVGIVDYSRRETDDFGVTTVVERGFAHRMSVRLAVPTGDVDALQRRLADLRATAALWVADERFESLSFTGFYKDFSIDLAVPPLSFCTLTVEGLASGVTSGDDGRDPAADQKASTLRLLQPQPVTDAMLASINVPENDETVWDAGATYPHGGRVIHAHRRWESLVVANAGHEPVAASSYWVDIGPTNRWAMFDEALGTSTTSPGNIVVTIDPVDAVNAVALLDVSAALVRVQATGYDRAKALVGTLATFLDLPDTAGPITISVSGSGVSVGTLLLGRLVGLGRTEASPTAEITDYSRKEVDEFGEVDVVERAWAKRMAVKALLRTDAVDIVKSRIARVRARPCLWIGAEGLETLSVYGFFRDFAIEISENVSKLSLSIEGLSKAAPIAPIAMPTLITVYRNSVQAPAAPGFDSGEIPQGWTLAPVALPAGQYRWSTQAQFLAGKQQEAWSAPVKVAGLSWTDIVDDDPDRPKPEDGATNGMNPDEREQVAQLVQNSDYNAQNIIEQALRLDDAQQILDFRTFVEGQPINLKFLTFRNEQTDVNMAVNSLFTLLGLQTPNGTGFVLNGSTVQIQPGKTLTQYLTEVGAKNAEYDAKVGLLLETVIGEDDGLSRALVKAELNGTIAKMVVMVNGSNGQEQSIIGFQANKTVFLSEDGNTILATLGQDEGGAYIPNLKVDRLQIGTRGSTNGGQVVVSNTTVNGTGTANYQTIISDSITLTVAGMVTATASIAQSFPGGDETWNIRLQINGQDVFAAGGQKTQDVVTICGALYLPAGTYPITVRWAAPSSVSARGKTLKTEVLY